MRRLMRSVKIELETTNTVRKRSLHIQLMSLLRRLCHVHIGVKTYQSLRKLGITGRKR